MAHGDVKRCVESCGIRSAHYAFVAGSAPPLPWAVYYQDEESALFADGTNYVRKTRWVVELYQKTRDSELEMAVEDAILRDFGPFRRYESWISDENCLMVAYHFTEIERRKQNG